ncbi:MAG: 2Fe-2S iron-sulfur cluster-binding protein, partial [Myxococcota bacterium]
MRRSERGWVGLSTRKGQRKLELPGFFEAPPELTITFEGRPYGARRGETLAQTLLAHGIYVTGRSAKYHRPRGLFCGRGACGHCMARIDGFPNQRTCTAVACDGSQIESQNVVGSARFDLLSTIDWLFPGGIDHHRLMTESTPLNRVTIAMARELSGLGELPDGELPVTIPEPEWASEVLSVRVAVVGNGPAGSAAASATKEASLDTLVIDPFLESPEGLTGARVIGFYDDRDLLAASPERLWRIRADAIVLATGGYEQLPSCAGNDMPGILARRAVESALDVGVLPGKRVAVALDPAADASTRRRARALIERLADSDVMIEVALGLGDIPQARRSLDATLDAVEGRSRVRRIRVGDG